MVGPIELNQLSFLDHIIARGKRPELVLACIIKTSALTSFNTNPLKLEHMDVTDCSCVFESQVEPTNQGMQLKFPASETDTDIDVAELYYHLNRCIGSTGMFFCVFFTICQSSLFYF